MITAVFLLLTSIKAYAGYATVLIYHRFDENKYPTTSISTKVFEKQMRYLKENGYNVIPLKQLINYLENKKEIPPKTVVITIDDGYRSTMKAYRILKKYGFPFTIFLGMEGIARYPAFLTKEELRILKKDKLVSFGNHSYSHARFARLMVKMSPEKYEEFIKKDTEKAEKKLKKLLGYIPKIYAYPYGEYTKPYIEVLKSMGYKVMLSQDPQNVDKNTPLYLIQRQAIVGSWASMKHFRLVLNTEVLPVISHKPDIGYLPENPPKIIQVKIKNPQIYKNCQIYLTEIGWKRAKKKDDILFIDGIQKLRKWKNRIGIKCINKKTGKRATFFWSVYTK